MWPLGKLISKINDFQNYFRREWPYVFYVKNLWKSKIILKKIFWMWRSTQNNVFKVGLIHSLSLDEGRANPSFAGLLGSLTIASWSDGIRVFDCTFRCFEFFDLSGSLSSKRQQYKLAKGSPVSCEIAQSLACSTVLFSACWAKSSPRRETPSLRTSCQDLGRSWKTKIRKKAAFCHLETMSTNIPDIYVDFCCKMLQIFTNKCWETKNQETKTTLWWNLAKLNWIKGRLREKSTPPIAPCWHGDVLTVALILWHLGFQNKKTATAGSQMSQPPVLFLCASTWKRTYRLAQLEHCLC